MASPSTDSPERALEWHEARAREVEHRVKNTLQLISSIVLLQGRRAGDEGARAALRAVQQRVAAVSVAHRHVGWEGDAEQVELAALVREIVGDLAGSAGREGVEIDLDLESVTIAGRQGVPVALLVSEAVGNALRHAYPPGRAGRVRVALRRIGRGFELSVADDGVGIASGAPPAGFGLTLAQLMAQQLRGRLTTDVAQPGVRLSVVVPMDSDAVRG
ncbi:MAG: sensor histidine kinase [Phenylobacterium sp.]|uniref:sensor histidine kinase n=1 Tax=Phenylobacterium sp. TaxID=1871053 RepID=UPI001A3A475F|nr:sensor histidine kinase [Phenylobacterium sp.]MBL8555524.1 sensor histidine kinase [Phenylobacterium sp.]